MSLIVEDGTGLSDADSYVTLAFADAYFTKRGVAAWEAADDDAREAALRRAAEYIDGKFRYKGSRLLVDQAREFPRSSLIDWSGYTITGVPARVQHAACELALRSLSSDLAPDLARGGMIQSESVGPISTTYAAGAPAETAITIVNRYLSQYVRDPDVAPAPAYEEPATDPAFSIGSMDNPQRTTDATGAPIL